MPFQVPDLQPPLALTVGLGGFAELSVATAKHFFRSGNKELPANKEFAYDAAFHVMRDFNERLARHTVEDVQRFSEVFVPSPPWILVLKSLVSHQSCKEADDLIAKAIGEEDLRDIVGGDKWWRRRLINGVEAEWISMKRDWKGPGPMGSTTEIDDDASIPTSPTSEEGFDFFNRVKSLHKRVSTSTTNVVNKGLNSRSNSKDSTISKTSAHSPPSTGKSTSTTLRATSKVSTFLNRRSSHPDVLPELEKSGNQEKGLGSNDVKKQDEKETKIALQEVTEEIKVEEVLQASKSLNEGDGENATQVHDPSISTSTIDTTTTNLTTTPPSTSDNTPPVVTPNEEILPTTNEGKKEVEYESHLDEMPVLLYIHGGGFYWGDINTHRYTIWRHARKMGGRAFAVRYRLSPQFPFPCALSDVLASYLYLIKPPKDAKHLPIDPNKIVIAGDSAGGNLALQLLCLLRDLDLPSPAGGVLISPFCDLTHSFPSVISNADTDFLPHYGFVHKPSKLWPVQARSHLDKRTKRFRPVISDSIKPEEGDQADPSETTGEVLDKDDGTIKIKLDEKIIELGEQVQMYATNEQLCYRYVSPLFQPSLGGLPPLLITVGDKERLRDEIIYLAHRAANPSKYPLRDSLLDAQPEIVTRASYYPPTDVHLQLYDGVCHDFILFSFTSPAKYLFRSIASFTKWVQAVPDTKEERKRRMETMKSMNGKKVDEGEIKSDSVEGDALVSRRLSVLRMDKVVEGPKRKTRGLDKTIYTSLEPFHRPTFTHHMIRERVNTSGVVRPMEDEEKIDILNRSKEEVGALQEGAIRMYLDGYHNRDTKYKSTIRRIENQTKKSEKKIQSTVQKVDGSHGHGGHSNSIFFKRKKTNLPNDNLTGITKIPNQVPPPGSLAGRRNTMEARELVKPFEAHRNMPVHPLNVWSEIHDVASLKD